MPRTKRSAARQLSAPAEHRPAFRELLERCARQGLLMSLPDLVARFGQPQLLPAGPPPEIVVRTADRPQLLLRLLQGAEKLHTRAGCVYRWHVVDDSRHEASRRANRAAIARCSALGAMHHDLSLPQSLEAELCGEFPDLRAEIGLLLAAPRGDELTYGRPINYLLLRFAGRRLLMLDDDVLIDPRRPALSPRGTEVSLAPEVAYWYESADAALRACPALDVDPFAAHAQWLGLPLAQAWTQAMRDPGGLRVGDLPAACGAAFAADARVLFTRNHVLGDPGWAKFASAAAGARRRKRSNGSPPTPTPRATPSKARSTGAAGSALRIAPHQTLSATTLSGFDNSRLLPPTKRSTRGGDELLGEAARCVYPSGWQAELPFALPHLRDAPRQWLRPDEKLSLEPSLLLITHARAHVAVDSRRRRRGADAHARRVPARSRRRQRPHAPRHARGAGDRVRGQDPLQHRGTVGRFVLARRVARAIAAVAAARRCSELDRYALRASLVAPEQVRSEAQHYGRTLVAWPQIWDHCRERFA